MTTNPHADSDGPTGADTPTPSADEPAGPAPSGAPSGTPGAVSPDGAVDCEALHAAVIERIQTVFDPEIPVNIHELGLIYDVDVEPTGNVHINMTLTSPSCPSAQELPMMVRGAAGMAPGVAEVEVDVVFDPPWTPEKMSEAARLQLGMM